jgi:signal transduction histidine kinase
MLHHRPRWFISLFFFAAAVLMAGLAFAGYTWFTDRLIRTETMARLDADVRLHAERLAEAVYAPAADIKVLAGLPGLHHASGGGKPPPPALEALFEDFARAKVHYRQIRFIDAQGEERIRVDRTVGGLRVVPTGELQNKAGRYYFTEAMTLAPGQVYLSPIDLNVEHDRIEEPWRPMLRIATPVSGRAGAIAGIIVINMDANRFLHSSGLGVDAKSGRRLLLNEAGYLLAGAEPEALWGFMFGREAVFPSQYPEAWERLGEGHDGQFWSGNELYTLRTITPSINLAAPASAFSNQRFWYLVDVHSVSSAVSLLTTAQGAAMAFAVLLLLAWVSWQTGGLLYERTHNRVALEQQRLELMRSNQDLEQFAYVASHDLKSPLRGIANAAHWLQDDLKGRLEGEQSRLLELIGERIKHMESMLDGILEYSRIGRRDYRTEEVDPCAVIEEIRDQGILPQSFEIVTEPGLPRLTTKLTPFQQVMQNLIVNAVKHHDRDHGTIRISARPNGDYVRFSVEDDGPGIPERYRDRIFGMFERLTPESEGSGIGLALVKKLVERQGGSIDVQGSGTERGTVFNFEWPLQEPQA